ncbi:FG-GAP repeat domain-containing protein [Flexithrix dorotheae]|uniref:FG-GAP repeat domain-containing protein n=1 Tax=Flexithrix dorotheae TaxID=70993 RepID=UPI0003745D10|nr:VCBS repeat-containing protein [Flexithrix dorotheae]
MKLFFRTLLPILFIIKSSILFGQFTDITPDSLPGIYDGDISLGDYDKDGDLDILATGLFAQDQFITHVLKNNGGVFEKAAIQPDTIPGVAEGKAEWGDVNGDGLLDIFIAGRFGPWNDEEGKTLVYYNKGDDIFELATNTGLPELAQTDATLVDFNNDNIFDVLLTGRIFESKDESYYQAALYANDGEGKFTEVHIFNKLSNYYNTNLLTSNVDFNNDGMVDFLINQPKPGESLRIYLN